MSFGKLISKYDKNDYLGKLVSFPEQCREGWKIGKKVKVAKAKGIDKIFITGMGGSGYVGEVIQKSFFQTGKVPVFIEHGYILPKFVDNKTFCIVVSYSGNTDEALTIFRELNKRKIPSVGISSNGKLAKACKKCVIVPGGMQPRQATGYLLFSTLAMLAKAGLSPLKQSDIFEAIKVMETNQKQIMAKAGSLAKTLHKKLPVIYATEALNASAIRWQTEHNEIAKVFLHWNLLPELQHNEINAYLGLGKAHFIFLKRTKESKKMNARIQYMKKRVRSIGYNSTDIEAKGKGILAQIWYANYLGSLTAFYLSMLHRIDPTPVNLIESMKAYLKKNT